MKREAPAFLWDMHKACALATSFVQGIDPDVKRTCRSCKLR